MRPMGAVIATLLVLAAACSARRFRGECEGARVGEPVVDLARRLEAAGGGYVGKIGSEYHWTRSKGLFKAAD